MIWRDPTPFFPGSSLPTLPPLSLYSVLNDDILHQILPLLIQPHLAALARTNSHYRALATPYLYKTVTLGGARSHTGATIEYLTQNPDVAALVTELRVEPHLCKSPVLPVLPRLRSLHRLVVTLADLRQAEPFFADPADTRCLEPVTQFDGEWLMSTYFPDWRCNLLKESTSEGARGPHGRTRYQRRAQFVALSFFQLSAH